MCSFADRFGLLVEGTTPHPTPWVWLVRFMAQGRENREWGVGGVLPAIANPVISELASLGDSALL